MRLRSFSRLPQDAHLAVSLSKNGTYRIGLDSETTAKRQESDSNGWANWVSAVKENRKGGGMRYDVLIIGGGIVGCALARELSRFRLAVGLVEKEAEVGFGTTKANSGIIHGGHHAGPATLKGRLEWEGNQLWDSLCEELGFGFRRIGELTVARTSDELSTLERLRRQGEAKGVPGLEIWDQDRLRREEPHLAPELIAGLHAPTTGVINPYEACYGLFESAIRNGVHAFLGHKVTALDERDGLWTVHTDRADLHGRYILNVAGLFADEIAQLAGQPGESPPFTIRPRKGEEYLLDKRLAGIVKRVIFPCPSPVSKGILVIPTFDGTIMVGPTATATDDRTDLRTTAAGEAEVFGAVRLLVPGISPRDCIAEFAGLRAATAGEDFIIEAGSRPGLIHVAGIQSPGLTAAPAIAELLVDILAQEGLPLVERVEFAPTLPPPVHFAACDEAAQMALAAADPAYGRIVCRCETVTEAEVVAAIARGAWTLDGLKFRTRAGMGRCQGGFCTARCMDLLARELGVPVTEVTKRGGASRVAFTREEIQATEEVGA